MNKIEVGRIEIRVMASKDLSEDKLQMLCNAVTTVFDSVSWADILQQKLVEAGINKGLSIVTMQ